MAYRILILILSQIALSNLAWSDDLNTADPNLPSKPDGAMNYDTDSKLNRIDATAGAIILKDEPLKFPKLKKKKESKPEEGTK